MGRGMCLLASLEYAAGWGQRGGLGVVRRGRPSWLDSLAVSLAISRQMRGGHEGDMLLLSLGVLCLVRVLGRSLL